MPEQLQRDVEHFHRACDLFIGDEPGLRKRELLASLIAEEATETLEAITGYQVAIHYSPAASDRGPNLVNAIDGICDLMCVLAGAAVMWGIEIEPFWQEILRANLAKAGGPRREDGKQMRPEGWQPPQLDPILALQKAEATIPAEIRVSNERARDREAARRQALHSLDRAA